MAYKEKFEKTKELFEGLDDNDISSILSKWKEAFVIRTELEEFDALMRENIKVYLKSHYWKKYLDPKTKISVSLTTHKEEKINEKELRTILSDSQLAQVTRIKAFEKLDIITPEVRGRLKKYVKGKN